MALFVIPVPQPPAGVDWSYTVPGQYIEHITAISATLTTGGGAPTVLTDATGNGNNGTYSTFGGFPHTVPGLVAGDLAMQWGDPASANPAENAQVPHKPVDLSLDLTVELWVQVSQFAHTTGAVVGWNRGFPSDGGAFIDSAGQLSFSRSDNTTAQVYTADASAIITDGLPHYVVMTLTAAGAAFYVDGVSLPPTLVFDNGVPTSIYTSMAVNLDDTGASLNATFDELALYNTALSGAQVSAHQAAASVSFAAYEAAVFADTPAAYYHLDESGTGTSRQVDLAITDGTHTVLEVPTGFAAPSGSPPYGYSWQPNLNSSTQTPDGTLTTIATPNLILPAGYTIGTRTLDLTAGDQWSAINIWWDDSVMQSDPALNPIDYPPGAYLVIVPQGA